MGSSSLLLVGDDSDRGLLLGLDPSGDYPGVSTHLDVQSDSIQHPSQSLQVKVAPVKVKTVPGSSKLVPGSWKD